MFGLPSYYFAIAGAILFGLALWKAYDTGYNFADARCQAAMAELKLKIEQEYSREIKRLVDANELAKNQQQELIQQLLSKEAEIDSILEGNANEVINDPTASDCGISATGVQRLNRIN